MATKRRATEKPPSISEMIEAGADPFDYLVAPIDFLILQMLPEEGDLVMGLYPNVLTVRDMGEQEPFNKLPDGRSEVLGGRLRSMQQWGLTVPTKSLGSIRDLGWQITPRGKEVLKKWLSKT